MGFNDTSTLEMDFASIDNVDKSSIHAPVKAVGRNREIHATSYQLVEPKPKRLVTAYGSPPTHVDSDTGQASSDIILPPFVTVKDINELQKQR